MSGSGEEAPEEKLARRRLEPYVGRLEQTDVPGTSGRSDYRLLGSRGSDHVEVTSQPDKRRRIQRAAIRKQRAFTVPMPGKWTLCLYRNVDTRNLPGAPGLETVLEAAKQAGRLIVPGSCPLEVADQMHSLGIEAARYQDADGANGTVSLTGAAREHEASKAAASNTYLEASFQQPSVLDRVEKLRRAGGDSRHLYLQVDSASEAGLAIALALGASNDPGAAPYNLPTYEPPDDLTDLWVWPDCPGPGLHYRRYQGWEIVQDGPGSDTPRR